MFIPSVMTGRLWGKYRYVVAPRKWGTTTFPVPNVTMGFASRIHSCRKYFDDYIECLRSKGLIANKPEAALPAPKPNYPWERDWLAQQEAEDKESAPPDSESEIPGDSDT